MKYILFLLLTVSALAQTKDNTFVIGKNPNVVYRGADNPVTISVDGVEASKLTVSGQGITKGEGAGNYIIRPGSGKELVVTISFKDKRGNKVEEKRKYRILNLPPIVYTVNGEYEPGNTYKLTKNQMIKLKIGTTFYPECYLFENAEVKSFRIKASGYKTVLCYGNKLNAEAIRIINKLTFNGETIIIDNVEISRVEGYNALSCKVSPIVIKLIH